MSIEMKKQLVDSKRRIAIDTKYAIHHIGHKRWDIISKNAGPEIELWRNFFELGKKNLIDHVFNSAKHSCCGEELYQYFRPKFISINIIKDDTKEKQTHKISKIKITGKKPMNKASKIKQENTIRKLKIEVDSILKMAVMDSTHLLDIYSFHSKTTEMIMIKMMLYCKLMISKYQKLINKMNHALKSSASSTLTKEDISQMEIIIQNEEKKLIEIVIGFNKFINEKKTEELLSKTCLNDLQYWIDQIKTLINFNPKNIIIRMPDLIFRTSYDMLLQKQMKLYPSQIDIFNFITQNDKYLALVHTMLGSGKTTMILPFCGWVMMNRKTTNTKIVFCCPNEVVLLEVAHMVYGMGVSFAIVIYNQKYDQLEYKWSSFADKANPKDSSVLYLCDMFVARRIMEERMEYVKTYQLYMHAHKKDPRNYPLTPQRVPIVPDYILMGDELTKDADSQNGFMVDSGFSVTTEVLIDLMKIAPPKIILMSATLPTIEQIPHFYDEIIKSNPGMIIKSFAASEAKIGCAIISSTGELYAPHLGCKTVDDIIHVLSVIKGNPFVGRFYTFEVLLQMIENYQQLVDIYPDQKIVIPNLTVMFDDPNQATQTNIQQIAYQMLETLIGTGTNEIIQRACQMNKSIGKNLDLSTIFTSDVGRFNKGCLIFSSNPISTAYQIYRANFNHFLDQETEDDIFQQIKLDNIISKYHKELELWQKALERINSKSDDSITKHNKESNKKERKTTESWQAVSTMIEEKPKWGFPPALQLCTLEHLKQANCLDHIACSGSVQPEDLPENTIVPYDILTMLASGIGIYTTNSSLLDDDYLKTVLYLAKKGIVKTIFTDDSIAYGTNLAVSDIIVIDEPMIYDGVTNESIIEKHSIKTIFQMLGRAGRGGNLSYEARVYTTSEKNHLINKINAYIKGTLQEGSKDEITNINKAYQTIW